MFESPRNWGQWEPGSEEELKLVEISHVHIKWWGKIVGSGDLSLFLYSCHFVFTETSHRKHIWSLNFRNEIHEFQWLIFKKMHNLVDHISVVKPFMLNVLPLLELYLTEVHSRHLQ